MPELRLSAGLVQWQAQVARGRCYLFAAPSGIAATSLRQRLLDGQTTADSSLRWLPPLANGSALLAPGITLLSNLQVWENILLPQAYHGHGLPQEAERNLRRWLSLLRPGEEPSSWLHRPVARLGDTERRAALLMRALMGPGLIILLTADWLAPLSAEQQRVWVQLLVAESQTQHRSLLYLEDTLPVMAEAGAFTALQWTRTQAEGMGNVAAA
ncbi:MAG: hypothetical protein V4650_14850 [Pseudomonadota bacterium]